MNLDVLRKDIDDIDKELVALFEKRMRIVTEIANYKLRNNMDVFDKGREDLLLQKVDTYLNNKELSGDLSLFFQNLMDLSKNYQRKNCASFIKEAKMYIADKNYESAFGVLLGIDSTSPCSAESNALVKNIESKITAEDKKQWDLQMKMYNDDVALEKLRINAIKDVAVSYYKSKTRPNQTIIVK